MKVVDISNVESRSMVYNPEEFRENAHKVVDILADYLNRAVAGDIDKVLPANSPEEMLKNWHTEFPAYPQGLRTEDILEKVISLSNHLHHPRYIGHQVSGSLPMAAVCDMVSAVLNNGTAVYEMGPVSTVFEKILINWMAKTAGMSENADGFFTSGGTLGNLTALLAARQAKAGHDIWAEGVSSEEKLTVLVSEQAHYSIKRSVQVMGLGEEGAIAVPSDENYCMDIDALYSCYNKAVNKGKKVIAVVGSACTTATGSYDPLEKIADFCEKYNLWMHVDGAHGASALLSEKYRHLLKGVERADSLVWDAHKMMLMPSLITALIFKNKENSYEAFSQKASYIFEKDAREEWYNLAQRTMECTKTMMSLKLYTCLSVYGTKFFGDYVENLYDLTRKFAEIIRNSDDFELAVEPQSNIICFRYINAASKELNNLQSLIRKSILDDESFYIVKTSLRGNVYLRCTVINPVTTEADLADLLNIIREKAAQS